VHHHKTTPDSPIGIFDSGVGGLTVVRAIQAILPAERIIYFGDTARVPYGSKSQVTIRKYAQDDTAILMRYHPKMIIVACNTVSALALDIVRKTSGSIPVIGVLEAGAELAVSMSEGKRIGVIGTQATVCSNAYACAINEQDPDIEVHSKACPLFVPLAEEGFTDHPAARLIAEEYLREFDGRHIDTLVLGCTHYPILRGMIEKTIDPGIRIIDSAEAVARRAKELLKDSGMLNESTATATPHLLVSDLPQKFSMLYRLFMGAEMPDVELIDV
jgi:glutamate racemase